MEFSTLVALPFHEKKMWLHLFYIQLRYNPNHLFYCWLKLYRPMPENKTIPTAQFSSDTPLVSVFTASYKSKDKIQRPLSFFIKSNVF